MRQYPMNTHHFPLLEVNLDAMRQNAQVLCDLCGKNGISVAGIIKFSDGDLQVAKAYRDGGCAQLGVSRAKHLQAIKEAFPNTETLLTRSPTHGDMEATARYADLSLHSDPGVLKTLNEKRGSGVPVPALSSCWMWVICEKAWTISRSWLHWQNCVKAFRICACGE